MLYNSFVFAKMNLRILKDENPHSNEKAIFTNVLLMIILKFLYIQSKLKYSNFGRIGIIFTCAFFWIILEYFKAE